MKTIEWDIQARIVKNWGNHKRFRWGETDESVFITTDGIVGYYILKPLFLLDTQKMIQKNLMPMNVTCLCGRDEDYNDAKIAGSEMHDIELYVLKSETAKCYVNRKTFKEFVADGFTYQIFTDKTPIRIYYRSHLFAIVMPVQEKRS